MTQAEQNAREFLKYIADNEQMLRKAFAKNVKYDSELFDDIYQDSIIKCYESILKGTEVASFKDYFFISCKWNYYNSQNRKRKYIQTHDNEYFDNDKNDYYFIDDENENDEMKFAETVECLARLKSILMENFNSDDVELFWQYFTDKVGDDGCSYRHLANQTGLRIKEIGEKIKTIKDFIATSPKIKAIKQQFDDGSMDI